MRPSFLNHALHLLYDSEVSEAVSDRHDAIVSRLQDPPDFHSISHTFMPRHASRDWLLEQDSSRWEMGIDLQFEIVTGLKATTVLCRCSDEDCPIVSSAEG